MSDPRNCSSETRAFAMLDLCERTVRKQMPDLDDEETDGPFLKKCYHHFGSDMQAIVRMASAQWSHSFDAIISAADSMRVIQISTENKDSARQRVGRCDACGAHEEHCHYAIDLAGGNHCMFDWFTRPQNVEARWEEFKKAYDRRFLLSAEVHQSGISKSDMGRFYIGATCLRKAKLHFLASTFLQNIMYDMDQDLKEMRVELDHPELYLVDDKSTKDFLDLKHNLELCVADETRHSIPSISTDDNFWKIIDKNRESAAATQRVTYSAVVRGHTSHIISDPPKAKHTNRACNEQKDDPGSVIDDSMSEDNEALDNEHPQEHITRSFRSSSNPYKRRVVLDSDDESSDNEQPRDSMPYTTVQNDTSTHVRKSKRLAGRPASPVAEPASVRGSSSKAATTTVSTPASDTVRQPASAEIASTSSSRNKTPQQTTDSSSEPSNSSTYQAPAPHGSLSPQPLRQSNPSTIATAMRIPREGYATLGSRRAAMLGLMDVQHELTRHQMDDMATKVSRAVITMQELMHLAESR